MERLLTHYSSLHVVNLMHLRDAEIFRGVTAPPAVILCENKPPMADATVRYDSPKMSRGVNTTKQIIILDDDRVNLPVDAVRRDHSVWKSAFWGTATDWALVQRLREHGTLGDLASERGWETGAGCGIFNLKRKPIEERRGKGAHPPGNLVGRPLLREEEIPAYGGSLALASVKGTDLADRWRDKRTPTLFLGRQLLVGRAPRRGRLSAAYVPSGIVFSQRYWGISMPPGDEPLAQYLSALVNSDIAQYYLFLTTSRWGVERDDVLPGEISGLPVPEWHALPEGRRQAICELEDSLRHGPAVERDLRDVAAHQELQHAIADAYGLTARERDSVDEVVGFTIDFFHHKDASEAVKRPSTQDLDAYALTLASNLNPYLRQAGKAIDVTLWGSDCDPLQVVQLVEVALDDQIGHVSHRRETSQTNPLRSLSDALHRQVDENLAVRRNMRVYDPNVGLLIVKYAERRYWTKAAAHRDAGAIVSDHLG
ncbi:MAG: hypothetical protein KKI08_26295 [Armatimonadetes bacterium]|nr:hypothetical protein [Armatimonadota bacterium]